MRISKIVRKFERFLFGGLPSTKKQTPLLHSEEGTVLGTFHYDFEKQTEEFIPNPDLKK